MSKIGASPAGVYSDDGLRLMSLLSPDGSKSIQVKYYSSFALLQADLVVGELLYGYVFDILYFWNGFNLKPQTTPTNKKSFPDLSYFPRICDGVIANLSANLVAVGDSLPSDQKRVLIPCLEYLMASTVWPKIVEMGLFLGTTFNGSLVKIKYPVGAQNALKDASTQGFTSAAFAGTEYSLTGGINPGASTKMLVSDLNPSTNAAINAGEWGFAVLTLDTYGGATAIAGGVGGGQNAYLGYNGSASIGGAGVYQQTVKSLLGLQVTGGNAQSWFGGYLNNSAAGASATKPNGRMALCGMASGTANGYPCSSRIAGYAVFNSLTQKEWTILSKFFNRLNYALGRPVYGVSGTANWMGDSVTSGSGVVTGSNKFSTAVSAAFGLTEINNGVGGRALVSVAGNANAFAVTSANTTPMFIQAGISNMGAQNFMCFGVNDAIQGVDPVVFDSAYRQTLDSMIAAGVEIHTLTLISPPARIDQSIYSLVGAYTKKIAAICIDYGIKFADLYNSGVGSAAAIAAGAWADNVHPNDLGHTSYLTPTITAAVGAPLATYDTIINTY